MPFDKIDIESITEERRKSVAKSIRTISAEELKKLGDEVFHDLDDPWREVFFRFVAEHSQTTIHYAYDNPFDVGMTGLLGFTSGSRRVRQKQQVQLSLQN